MAALRRGRMQAIDTSPLLADVSQARGEDLESAVTKAALAFSRALAHGVTDPDHVHGIFGLETNQIDLESGLSRALSTGSLVTCLDGLAPQDAEYKAISNAYLAYVDRRSADDIPAGRPIRPGARDPRLQSIAQALSRLGYISLGPLPQTYTPALVAAVREFQSDSGLEVDGVVGRSTLAMLNKGPGDRARQLAVNLERRRWLVRDPPPDRIDVNLAAGQLIYYRDGEPAWRTLVIAGAPPSPTPLIEESFSQIVVNPPWHVPASIAEREILPKGPSYLEAHNMYVTRGRVVQRPSPGSALGQVKFDMQNRYAIYLHDTPSKALFERRQRFFSHGCVRVKGAVEFARRLAEESGKASEFETALDSGETEVVRLDRDIPVRLLYRTAFLDQDRQVSLRLDPYGLDDKVGEAMGLGSAGRAADNFDTDVGP
jgi:murein L,D-transpeptidase YcbB/YkuD